MVRHLLNPIQKNHHVWIKLLVGIFLFFVIFFSLSICAPVSPPVFNEVQHFLFAPSSRSNRLETSLAKMMAAWASEKRDEESRRKKNDKIYTDIDKMISKRIQWKKKGEKNFQSWRSMDPRKRGLDWVAIDSKDRWGVTGAAWCWLRAEWVAEIFFHSIHIAFNLCCTSKATILPARLLFRSIYFSSQIIITPGRQKDIVTRSRHSKDMVPTTTVNDGLQFGFALWA